jgi:hypothetical protein
MTKEILLKALKKQTKDNLIFLLLESFEIMNKARRYEIFNSICDKEEEPKFNAQKIFLSVKKFYNDSIAKKYYAPFAINSKNFSNVPEETELWCDMIADLFEKAIDLNTHDENEIAVKCFDMLFYLQENMCEEIVFAHELDTWMIPIKQSKIIPIFIESAAKICEPEEFKKHVKMLMLIDDFDYKKEKVFNKAIKVGTKNQKKIIEDLKPKEKRR